IVGRLSDAQFNWQPTPDRWSIGQAVEHMNITTERYGPVLTKAIADARAGGRTAPGPFALGLLERWFFGAMEPPPRRRFRTRATFVPVANLPLGTTIDRFVGLQEEFARVIQAAEGLDLAHIKVRSQFGPISWSLNGTFAILLAHERRHIWQAREVRNDPAFPRAQERT
ncbi:MAG: DinB family protein, partial [Thermoanaerobaculia bacterium]